MSDSHGNTPAAWTAVLIGLAAFAVGSVGLMFDPVNMLLFWVGVAMIPLAGVVFFVMAKAGMHQGH